MSVISVIMTKSPSPSPSLPITKPETITCACCAVESPTFDFKSLNDHLDLEDTESEEEGAAHVKIMDALKLIFKAPIEKLLETTESHYICSSCLQILSQIYPPYHHFWNLILDSDSALSALIVELNSKWKLFHKPHNEPLVNIPKVRVEVGQRVRSSKYSIKKTKTKKSKSKKSQKKKNKGKLKSNSRATYVKSEDIKTEIFSEPEPDSDFQYEGDDNEEEEISEYDTAFGYPEFTELDNKLQNLEHFLVPGETHEYKCTFCTNTKSREASKTYTSSVQLLNHLNGHFLKSCRKCSVEFKSKYALEVHLHRNHEYPRPSLKKTIGSSMYRQICVKWLKDDWNSYMIYQYNSENGKIGTGPDFMANKKETEITPLSLAKESGKTSAEGIMEIDVDLSEEEDDGQSNYPRDKDTSKSSAPIQCTICSRTCKTFSLLTQHMQVHQSYPCRICNLTFTGRKQLRRHKDTAHPETVKKNKAKRIPRICPFEECGKRFYNGLYAFNQHKLTHEPGYVPAPVKPFEKNYRCEKCDMSFRFEAQLLKHSLSHVDEPDKPFQCDQCGKGYRTRDNLNLHIKRQHRNKHLFPCDRCDKTFALPTILRKHIENVHERKMGVCHVCGKSFKQERHLKVHIIEKHLGESEFKYQCEVCQKKFARLDQIKGHRIKFNHFLPGQEPPIDNFKQKQLGDPSQITQLKEDPNSSNFLQNHLEENPSTSANHDKNNLDFSSLV